MPKISDMFDWQPTEAVSFEHCQRPRHGWDRKTIHRAVDNGWDDPFVLAVLQEVDAGKAHCSCCQRPLASMQDVALVSTAIRNSAPAELIRGIIDAYCAPCVAVHGIDLLDAHAAERLCEPQAGAA